MAQRKREPNVGDIFEIPLGDGKRGYGHVLIRNLVGFYAIASDERRSVEDIVREPVAFRVMCMKDAIRDGRWPVIGNVPPPAAMNEPTRFWRTTAPEFIFLHPWDPDVPHDEVRVSRSEIHGVEKGMIWNTIGIVNRINAFLRGEPHPLVETG